MALAGLAGGCGATHAGTASVPRAPGNRSVADSRTVPTTTLSSPTTSAPSIDPGRLSQTAAEPDFGAGLDAQMQTLWAALVTGSTSLGRRVFFPEAAYVRMKTRVLPNPAGDYTWRLIAFEPGHRGLSRRARPRRRRAEAGRGRDQSVARRVDSPRRMREHDWVLASARDATCLRVGRARVFVRCRLVDLMAGRLVRRPSGSEPSARQRWHG